MSLNANVVVLTCGDCDFEFTGPGAEVARHEAVCRHLGIMDPRGDQGFARPIWTVAAILRVAHPGWAQPRSPGGRRGSLLQNRAYDSPLVLALLRGQSWPAPKQARGSGSGRLPCCVFGAAGFHRVHTEILACGRDPGDAPTQRNSDKRLGALISAFAEEWAHPGRARMRGAGNAVPGVFSRVDRVDTVQQGPPW